MDSRYSRQEVLALIGKDGQKKISASHIAIVGCGALGSVSAELLARAGIGNLTLIDHDIVELSNLQRQAVYAEQDIGKPKAESLKYHLKKINSQTKLTAHVNNMNFENIKDLVKEADLILDCTDNLDSRFLINEFCAKENKPWIHSAAIQERGVILNIVPGPETPCFRCIFSKASQGASCEELGILNSTSHMTSAIQVTEAIKILLDKDPEKCMIRIDSWNHRIQKFKVNKDKDCPVCAGKYTMLEGKTPDLIIKKCRTKKGWTVKQRKNVQLNLEEIKKNFKVILDAGILVVIDHEGEIIVHGYGELVFKHHDDEERIKDIADRIYKAGGLK